MILRAMRAVGNWLTAPYRSRVDFERDMERVTRGARQQTAESLKKQRDLEAYLERTSSLTNDVFASTPPPRRHRA